MSGHGKRVGALLLAVCLVLSLAACGDKDKGDSSGEKLSGTAYLPEFKTIEVEGGKLEGINSGDVVAVDRGFFFIAHMSTPAEGEDGMESWSQGVFHMDTETGKTTAIEGFTFGNDMEDPYSNTYLEGLCGGADGTVWIGVTSSKTIFDLPEGFDEEKDDIWNYYSGTEDNTVWHRIDADGNEISSMELLKDDSSANDAEVQYISASDMVFDNDGCYYYKDDSYIYVVDPASKSTIKVEAKEKWGSLYRLSDGTVGLYDWGDEMNGPSVTVVDKAGQKLGKSYPLEGNINGEIFGGSGKYLFGYTSGDALYGYIDEKTPAERLFTWSDVDLDRNSIQAVSFMEDGRVAAFSYEYGASDEGKAQFVALKPVDAATLPEKTHLTLACQYMDSELRRSIIDFNRKNSNVRIDIRDYSEYNTKDDYNKGLTKLSTEIVAGNVPDLLMVDGLPVAQYVAKGLLEDLWPFIDNDPDLSRDKLMIRPLEAAQVDGILPQVFNGFSIQTVAGPTKIVGDKIGWTVADLNAAMEKMPEGARIFSDTTTKAQILGQFLTQFQDEFIDWKTGECRFDSPEFMEILKFSDQFAADFDSSKVNWQEREGESSVVQRGMQLLMTTGIGEFHEMQLHKGIFGTDFTYIGFPTADGSSGSSFSTSSGIAMSSKCKDKDAAWEFMRTLLMDNSEDLDHLWNFPINKAMFDKFAEKQMHKEYQLDENGNKVLDENGQPVEESQGGWGMDDIMVDVYGTTQEEYDKFMELYNATDSLMNWNEEISNIVLKEAEPFFSGDKSVEETAKQIQSRMNLYINEQM